MEQIRYPTEASVKEHCQHIHPYHSGKLAIAEHSTNLGHHTVTPVPWPQNVDTWTGSSGKQQRQSSIPTTEYMTLKGTLSYCPFFACKSSLESNSRYIKYKELAHMACSTNLSSQQSLEVFPIWISLISMEVATCRKRWYDLRLFMGTYMIFIPRFNFCSTDVTSGRQVSYTMDFLFFSTIKNTPWKS